MGSTRQAGGSRPARSDFSRGSVSGIEAVVFDVGNVLFHWNPRHLYERLIEDRDRLDWFLANVVTLDWHFQLDAGRSFAECAEALAARFPDERPLIEAWLHRFHETLEHTVPAMAELAEALDGGQVPPYDWKSTRQH